MDGILSPYGKVYDLDLDEAVEELIYFDIISEQFTEEELRTRLIEMSLGYIMYGGRWDEIKLTKNEI